VYYKEVAKSGYNFLLNRFKIQREMNQNDGGALRSFSGDTVELFMDKIFNEFKNYYNLNNYSFKVGSTSPVILGDGDIKESVDRHLYKNNILLCGIECKTYTDKCYMQRADSDFNLMKTDLTFQGWIVSLENGIKDTTSKFFMSRKNIDKIYYLATGKRQSKEEKRIYNNPERLQLNLIELLCKDLEEKFFKEQ